MTIMKIEIETVRKIKCGEFFILWALRFRIVALIIGFGKILL